MAVSVEPASVPATGGSLTLLLINSKAEVRFAFKIRCSNNTFYRVNPVYGFVEPGAAAEVEVVRKEGPPKFDDKLQICFVAAPADAPDAKALFTPSKTLYCWCNLPMATL